MPIAGEVALARSTFLQGLKHPQKWFPRIRQQHQRRNNAFTAM